MHNKQVQSANIKNKNLNKSSKTINKLKFQNAKLQLNPPAGGSNLKNNFKL